MVFRSLKIPFFMSIMNNFCTYVCVYMVRKSRDCVVVSMPGTTTILVDHQLIIQLLFRIKKTTTSSEVYLLHTRRGVTPVVKRSYFLYTTCKIVIDAGIYYFSFLKLSWVKGYVL